MAARPILPVQEMALLAQGLSLQAQELARQPELQLMLRQVLMLGQVLQQVLVPELVLGQEQVLGPEHELPASPEGSSDA